MKDFKIFISEGVLYIYKKKKSGEIQVVAVEEDIEEGYIVKTKLLDTSLTGQELEKYIVYAMSNYKPDVKASELSSKEVYDKVDNMTEGMSKDDTVAVLNTFVLPEKKKTPVESILADILKLSYKERSDVLVALLDMM